MYLVEYKGLSLVCFSCGGYEHQSDGCPRVIVDGVPKEPFRPKSKSQQNKRAQKKTGNLDLECLFRGTIGVDGKSLTKMVALTSGGGQEEHGQKSKALGLMH